MATLLTVGVIAERLNVKEHKVNYVIDALGLKPTGRAGNLRVFSEDAVEQIRRELGRIAAQKGVNGG